MKFVWEKAIFWLGCRVLLYPVISLHSFWTPNLTFQNLSLRVGGSFHGHKSFSFPLETMTAFKLPLSADARTRMWRSHVLPLASLKQPAVKVATLVQFLSFHLATDYLFTLCHILCGKSSFSRQRNHWNPFFNSSLNLPPQSTYSTSRLPLGLSHPPPTKPLIALRQSQGYKCSNRRWTAAWLLFGGCKRP